MKHLLRIIFAFAIALFASSQGLAATCFWVGGAGTWSTTNTASWASSSGGTTGTCAATGGVPKQSTDTATFDGSSGGGTVVVDSTISGVTIQGLTTSAFTGTLDFLTNSPNITIGASGWNDANTGVHTINMGNGTWTFNNTSGISVSITAGANLTLNPNGSTVLLAPASTATNTRTFGSGNKNFNIVSISGTNNNGMPVVFTGSSTYSNLNIAAGGLVQFNPSTATAITNAFNWTGTSSNPIFLIGGNGVVPTVSVPASSQISWATINHITFQTNSISPSNSFNGGGNTFSAGGSISPPSGGGGSATPYVIGD